jgi:hypothetical protein
MNLEAVHLPVFDETAGDNRARIKQLFSGRRSRAYVETLLLVVNQELIVRSGTSTWKWRRRTDRVSVME